MTKNDKILGHVIGVIGGLMIGVVIGVAACMFNLIDINKQEQDKVVETDKENVKNPDNDEEQEDNKEAIAFCEANKDEIYKKIIENRNNSLAAKYDKKWLDSLYKLNSKDELNCSYIESLDYDSYNLYFDNTDKTSAGYFAFSNSLASVDEYILGVEGESEINYAFAEEFAYEIITSNWDKPNVDFWDFSVINIYYEDLVLVQIVDKPVVINSDLLSLYLVDLKTKTYEKLK